MFLSLFVHITQFVQRGDTRKMNIFKKFLLLIR
jgi:hypothetical protein